MGTRILSAGLQGQVQRSPHSDEHPCRANSSQKGLQYRCVMLFVALYLMARAYDAHVFMGDGNGATQWLYSDTRKEQQGGCRPDFTNHAAIVAARLVVNAINFERKLSHRIQAIPVARSTAYSLMSQEAREKLNDPCSMTADPAHNSDTLFAVIWDIPRSTHLMAQREVQAKYIVEQERATGIQCQGDCHELHYSEVPAANVSVHITEMRMHSGHLDQFYKNLGSSSALY